MHQKNLDQYEQSPLKLKSPLRRQLAASGLTRCSPRQWINTIRNMQQKGVSAVEIEWSDIIPTLERLDVPFVQLPELLDTLESKPPCELVLQRRVTNEYKPFVQYEKQQRPVVLPPPRVIRGRREVRLLHYLNRPFGLRIWLHIDVDTGLFGRNRYWSFSVPRGRKKLTEDPVSQRFSSVQEAMAYGRMLVSRLARRLAVQGFVGHVRSFNSFADYVLPGGTLYTEWLITAPHLADRYYGGHFDLPNIIAHVRTTNRIASNGTRLLVLEEVQSDWNQELRKAIQNEEIPSILVDEDTEEIAGWDDDAYPPTNPYLNHWLDAALRMMLLLAANEGIGAVAWLPGKLHAERFPMAEADGLKIFYDRIVLSAMAKLAKSWNVSLTTMQFSTLSRHYGVRRSGNKKWRVLNLDTGKIVGENFSDYPLAEAFRRSKEASVFESVPALDLTNQMRADICKNGLPCLGSVGKRL